jgi:hypothetical protein
MIGAKSGRKSRISRAHGISNNDTYTDEETAFLIEVNKWQQRTQTRFPAATEYLAIAKTMGCRKAD